MTDAAMAARFQRCFDGLASIGRVAEHGGYRRFAWTDEDRRARTWFALEASSRGLTVEADPNGNLWAWWGRKGPGAVVTGSHLDTVPDGGAYDGALGVVSGLLAVGDLHERGVTPRRPVGVVAFADEEGARFGVPTCGSRLLVGSLDPGAVVERTDAQGVSMAEALRRAGVDPAGVGAERERVRDIGAFVELHIEQGQGLVHRDSAVGVGQGIWPHGRWHLRARGEANHAGTTRLVDRRDPALVLAAAIGAARDAAARAGGVATVGRVLVQPNGTNTIAEAVDAWLDARAPDDGALDGLVGEWSSAVEDAAQRHRVDVRVACESRTQAVVFDTGLTARVGACVRGAGHEPVPLWTAAGHDAGALAGAVPAAMLFVRNVTGVSHSPAETADLADCLAGVRVLTDVIDELACR